MGYLAQCQWASYHLLSHYLDLHDIDVANRIIATSTVYCVRSHIRPLSDSGQLETGYGTSEESRIMYSDGPVAGNDDHLDPEDHLDQVGQPAGPRRSIRRQSHHLVVQRRAVSRHHHGMHPGAAFDEEDRILELPQRQLVADSLAKYVNKSARTKSTGSLSRHHRYGRSTYYDLEALPAPSRASGFKCSISKEADRDSLLCSLGQGTTTVRMFLGSFGRISSPLHIVTKKHQGGRCEVRHVTREL